MSDYLTNADFTAQAGGAFAGVSDPVLTKACSWASGQADMYLSKRYQLPLISFGDDLTSLVFSLAQWKVATQIGFRPASGQNEAIRLQYEDAIKQLTMISTGDLSVNVVDSTPDVDEEGSLSSSAPFMNFRDVIGGICGRCGFVGCRCAF